VGKYIVSELLEGSVLMYDYNEACPISMAASVICERWTLQIIRELFFGSTRFSEIQKYLPNISPSLLRNRLRFLEEQELILRKRGSTPNRFEYFLTPSGKALAPVITEMGKWGMRWASDHMTEKQSTASGLVRDIAGGLNIDELPSCDTVISINLSDVEESPTRYIHVQNGEAQVCDKNLGFEVDVYINSTLQVMTSIWYGKTEIHSAIKQGILTVVAAPVYQRRIKSWLGISSFTTDNPSLHSG
jgi:DNA-binding HxlR family transcriptional regulator